MWEWIVLRVRDNGGRNIKLEQAKFVVMSSLSKDCINVTVRKGSNSLVGWLAETCTQSFHTVSE